MAHWSKACVRAGGTSRSNFLKFKEDALRQKDMNATAKEIERSKSTLFVVIADVRRPHRNAHRALRPSRLLGCGHFAR